MARRKYMKHYQRGDISIFIVIIVSGIMLGSAVLLSLILARQTSLTEDIVASERAFYAASAGVEQGFYNVAKGTGKEDIDGLITYPDDDRVAEYAGTMAKHDAITCGVITGTFGATGAEEQRRIQIGPDGC